MNEEPEDLGVILPEPNDTTPVEVEEKHIDGEPTRYFVNKAGKYLGGWSGGKPPRGSVEVPDAPSHAAQVWDGEKWGPIPEAE